jgi:hypothetical protein
MAIGKITGQMLNYNLDRAGLPLVIDTDLTYFDVTNRRLGINTTSPQYPLDVQGNAHIGNLYIQGGNLTTDSGVKLNLGDISNVQMQGGQANYVLFTDGEGNLSFGNAAVLSSGGVFTGADITLGANTTGQLVSNALTLTSTTSVTNGIALINQVLGRLTPSAPPVFPAGQSITLASSTSSGRMANFTQTDRTTTGGKSVAAGTAVSAVRSSTYQTSAITNAGPGDSGTVTVVLNSAAAGSRTMTTGIDNGTYSNLIIANDQDYRNVVASVPPGFYQTFNAFALGTVQPGWNEVYILDTAGVSNTNTVSWYYDSSSPGAPFWANTSIPLTTNAVAYSSTIPHLTSSAVFTLKANVSSLSGDMYYTSDTFVVGSAAGAFSTPASKTYQTCVGIPYPLTRNLYVSSGSAFLQTSCSVVSGFGSSAVGPSLTAYNSYSSATNTFSPGVTVLYKTGTTTQIEETSLTIGTVGIGAGNPYRIVNPGTGDTPAYTGSEIAFNSQTSPLQTFDAVVVGAVLKHDTTNYSTGYLPVGPNLSTQGANQYFTFKFVRTGVSKFDILYSGTIAGLWVALPGQSNTYSTLNGWLDMSTPYAGSGIPGANTGTGGNGSNGSALGGTAILNLAQANKRVTATFGTLSSSSSTNNEIYVRVKLITGYALTALQIQAASN